MYRRDPSPQRRRDPSPIRRASMVGPTPPPCRSCQMACTPCIRIPNSRGISCVECERRGMHCTASTASAPPAGPSVMNPHERLQQGAALKTARVAMIEAFFEMDDGQLPPIYRMTLMLAASSDSESQPPVQKALLAAVIAVSSRATAEPAVVGTALKDSFDAYISAQKPSSSRTSAASGVDYARRRDGCCATLLSQALNICDASGCLRKPGVEQLYTLRLLLRLVPEDTASRRLPLSIATHGHLRALAEDRTKANDPFVAALTGNSASGDLFEMGLSGLWDAMLATTTGQSYVFTDGEVESLASMVGSDLRILSDQTVATSVGSMFSWLIRLTRLFYGSIAPPRRPPNRQSLDPQALRVFLGGLEELVALLKRASEFLVRQPPRTPLLKYMGSLLGGTARLLFSVNSLLSATSAPGSSRNNSPRSAELEKLHGVAYAECVRLSKTLVSALAFAQRRHSAVGSGLMALELRPYLGSVTRILLSPNVWHAGSGSSGTYNQVQALQRWESVLRSIVWSWPEATGQLAEVRNFLAPLTRPSLR